MSTVTARPLGYYVSSPNKHNQELIDEMQELWGSRFEKLDQKWKLLFRGALASYQATYQDYNEEANNVSCIDGSIVGAGGDDFNVWEEQPTLVNYIQWVANDFSELEIERFIEALTAQITSGMYEAIRSRNKAAFS